MMAAFMRAGRRILVRPAYFLAAASSWRNAAIVAAEGSLRLLFFGRRFVLLL
jgi:hypothetical protein